MRRSSETGKAQLSTLIFLVLLAAAAYAAWNVAPVYFDHYDFVDKVNEICRTPRYKVLRGGDEDIMKMLMDEVKQRRLTTWIGPESFAITTTSRT